jgi:Uri superfamily endonuclease
MTDFWTTADEIPALTGAYVLAINLSELVVVSICRKPSAPLAPGCYLYCGSAKGPGGLAARLARHMRHGKAIRWHVDCLTEAGTVLGAWTFPGGDECDLVAALSHLPVPIEGFRSTDCRRCRRHLLRWQIFDVAFVSGRDKPKNRLHIRKQRSVSLFLLRISYFLAVADELKIAIRFRHGTMIIVHNDS